MQQATSSSNSTTVEAILRHMRSQKSWQVIFVECLLRVDQLKELFREMMDTLEGILHHSFEDSIDALDY